MSLKSAPMEEPVPVFRADHPFVFLITDDETGELLFMGRVADPTA
ncbi:serpin family protein [Methanogenium cariaci]|nr:serpin family protein [Methanogenium cariaci]